MNDEFWRQPAGSRRERVAQILAQARIDSPPEHEAIEARKKAERAERLKRHDEMFGIKPGDLVPDIYKIKRPVATAGDPDGRDD